jgi:hypothetical protein
MACRMKLAYLITFTACRNQEFPWQNSVHSVPESVLRSGGREARIQSGGDDDELVAVRSVGR